MKKNKGENSAALGSPVAQGRQAEKFSAHLVWQHVFLSEVVQRDPDLPAKSIVARKPADPSHKALTVLQYLVVL